MKLIVNLIYFVASILAGFIAGKQIAYYIVLTYKKRLYEFSYTRWSIALLSIFILLGCMGELNMRFDIFQVTMFASGVIASAVCLFMIFRTRKYKPKEGNNDRQV